jgi:hypothetical protein
MDEGNLRKIEFMKINNPEKKMSRAMISNMCMG